MKTTISLLPDGGALQQQDLFLITRDGESYRLSASKFAGLDVNGKLIASQKPTYDFAEIRNTPVFPTRLSDLDNDLGYITQRTLFTAIRVEGDLTYDPVTGTLGYDEPFIPTKTSDLSNDAGFVTAANIRTQISASGSLVYDSITGTISYNAPFVPTKTSELVNDANFVSGATIRGQISVSGSLAYNTTTGVISYTTPAIPSKLSQLTNDAGFVTVASIRSQISARGDLSYNPATGVFSYTAPAAFTKVSQLENDAGFVKADAVRAQFSGAGSVSFNPTTGVISAPAIPTKASDLTNDVGFVTAAGIRGQISVAGSLNYNANTGVIAYTAPALATVATTGIYGDLQGLPAFGDGAYKSTGTVAGTLMAGDDVRVRTAVLGTRKVIVEGLATGGGPLSADVTVSVAPALLGAARDGVGDGVMTAALTAEAIKTQVLPLVKAVYGDRPAVKPSVPDALPTDGSATARQIAEAINALRNALVTLGLVQPQS